MSAKRTVKELLEKADITLNGPNSWDPQIHNDALYDRVLAGGTLALGEAYMDGWWDVEDLSEFFNKALRARLDKKVRPFSLVWHILRSRLINLQSRKRATQVAEEHYDLGNDLYQSMLDPHTMSYTCAQYSEDTECSFGKAQENKIDLLCRKIGLQKDQHILDIGSGFGGFAKHAAEKYGSRVTGVSLSKEQNAFARKKTKNLPVEILLQDYRDITGRFDHIVSIEMIEAVGYKNLRTYMEKIHEVLKDGGLFGLQVIVGHESATRTEPWLNKYIFPNGMLPSKEQLTDATKGLFTIEDWHDFGTSYDKTLVEWFKNFDAAWPSLSEKYGERFYRMWKYYLLLCAGSFRARHNQLFQVILSKNNIPGRYVIVR